VCPGSGSHGVTRCGPEFAATVLPFALTGRDYWARAHSEPERAPAANVALKSNILARGSKTRKPDRACCSHMDIYDIAIVVLMFVNAIIVIYIIATIRN
jgi:hypothetical protein